MAEMKSIPSPADMLEELADKVLTHMDRLAITSFNNALDEMVDFHVFLLESYTTSSAEGDVVSFAQLGDWRALHLDWIGEYSPRPPGMSERHSLAHGPAVCSRSYQKSTGPTRP